MRLDVCKPMVLAIAAFAAGIAPALVSAQDHPDDQHAMRADVHQDQDQRRDDDSTARYRHDHPHASARCHDGFFTTTRDRNRACTKHGGIDVWLRSDL